MPRLCETDGLTEDQTEILKAVRVFVDEQIIPVAQELEHSDTYPTEIVEGLKEHGVFGLMIPEEYGGLGESLLTYALFRIAEMATKVEVAHTMMVKAARMKDTGQRMDVEAGMAKMVASEYAHEVVEDSFRIHGGYGYSKEYEIERLDREVAFMLIGEGTTDIQKQIIGRAMLKDYKLKG